jgi:hypothetical protein
MIVKCDGVEMAYQEIPTEGTVQLPKANFCMCGPAAGRPNLPTSSPVTWRPRNDNNGATAGKKERKGKKRQSQAGSEMNFPLGPQLARSCALWSADVGLWRGFHMHFAAVFLEAGESGRRTSVRGPWRPH